MKSLVTQRYILLDTNYFLSAGSYSGSASYAGSEASSESVSEAILRAKDHTRSYEYSDTSSTRSIGHSQGSQSSRSKRNRSRSPGSERTVTDHQQRLQVPRPRIPPDRPIPVYRQDPNDPARFLGVPRPCRQWNIPADLYNGAAWAVHRRSDFASGAIPSFYPDRWVSGQSYGNAAKDMRRKEIPANSKNSPCPCSIACRLIRTVQKTREEILGRECYRDLTPALTNNSTRSHSVASDLAGGFGAIRLGSAPPPSEYGGSELADDFDLYSSNMQLETYENTNPENPKETWSLANSSEQQITQFNSSSSNVDDDGSSTPIWSLAKASQQLTQLNSENSNLDDEGSATPAWSLASSSGRQLDSDSSDADDDGSSTPKQGLSYDRFFSREGSAVSDTFTFYNQRSMGGFNGNPLLVDDGQSSRESTPSLCLADFMDYDSRKVSSLLNSEGSQCNLIDLSSPAPSPNSSRCGSATPPYRDQSHSRADCNQSSFDSTGSRAEHILDDDWESSFGIVIGERRFTLSGTGNEESPLCFDDDDEDEQAGIPGGRSVSNKFQGLTLKTDADTDEPDFMGVNWFSKQNPVLATSF